MILVNNNILKFLKLCIKENTCIYDFTKTEGEFFRIYGLYKKDAKLLIKGLERQIMNAENDVNNATYEKIIKFIEESKQQEKNNSNEI